MALKTEPFVLNIGPLHPSTHGVFRLLATLDGEVVIDIEPIIGYLHRGIEKLAEEREYQKDIPLCDRLDYVAAMSHSMAYVMAVEKLLGISVPERAEYIRVIMVELQRIASHLLAVGSIANEIGTFFTPFMYMFRERERILDLFDMVCGQRLLYNYMRFGGVSHDLPEEFIPALAKFINQMPGYIDEYDQLLAENEILLVRTKGIGVLPPELAINCSVSGPTLRASGVARDIRRCDPYSIYDRFEFDIPTRTAGDCYDRYRQRIEEMRQSLRIIRQAVEQLPQGKVNSQVPIRVRPPQGDVFVHVEAPRGELGFYLVSDGSEKPYRFHIRAPSLINLTPLREMIIGWKLADAIVIFGSIDIIMGEIDR
ncbi:MAG: NADH-quinone oxidoreductase subunit D [Dehalococcoidales bacterium]|nr:NADH-quinone oxidoreductase subunit D [Dehalococcoidales bacterium]